MSLHRRDLLLHGAATTVALLGATALAGAAPASKPAPPVARPRSRLPGKHVPAPLPFKPGSLNGISEKLITSHHDKNYAAAVKNLNKVESDLAALAADAPSYLVAGLRDKELAYANSIVLHEHYFGNLGGSGKRSGALEARLSGERSGWESQVRAAAAGLGGGSGWIVVALSLHDGDLRISSSTSHSQALAFGAPLLVLDMYEHAYALDHGADHATYIELFFKNVAWEPVEARYERALKALAALG
jgi:superoxide dismutase, Fe-Mn family